MTLFLTFAFSETQHILTYCIFNFPYLPIVYQLKNYQLYFYLELYIILVAISDSNKILYLLPKLFSIFLFKLLLFLRVLYILWWLVIRVWMYSVIRIILLCILIILHRLNVSLCVLIKVIVVLLIWRLVLIWLNSLMMILLL